MKEAAAIIEKRKCHPDKCAQECIKYDPLNRSGGEGFHIGQDGKICIAEEVVSEMHKICSKKCPYSAIKIVKLPEALKKEPIHQYGLNGFRIFNLPYPQFGKVVGLLGINGIGKSTAIKVLAGVLKPNMGDIDQDKDADWNYDDLIEYFKGTENQLFFEKLRKQEVKVAFKPQQVDLLAKTVQGNVRDLLTKVDERGAFDEVVDKLQLNHVLDREISQVSGGELQRVAIAATIMREANFYIFDEPTSYLDVKQRLNVAKLIKSLADDKTAVLVIEHDLIILDYMTDLIHIMYGHEDGYGVIGLPRTTKNGINTFLSGYLPEENVQFRNKAVEFMKKQAKEEMILEELTSWSEIKKTQGSFKLDANAGSVFENEVVGVLGPNGIGKTTFIKILAGAVKSDSGDVNTKVKVAYKPQYIDTTSDVTVYELFVQVWDDANFTTYIRDPLNLDTLKLHKLSELSGGQVQRVAIANCMNQDADLYLLDEPSAYLDIEQRLSLSKIIKNIMELKRKTAIIVDHDLLFLDYISDRLMVFDGKPSVEGVMTGPMSMQEGMTHFLKEVEITFRRDEETLRPRTNKFDSQLDKQQKSEGKYYYT